MNFNLNNFLRLNKEQQRKFLIQCDKAYYELDNPLIPDFDYDNCVRLFNSKYKNTPYTSSLGKASNDFEKYNHEYPVLSLAKITTKDGYEKYGNEFNYNVVIEPKIDGLTVVYYPDGTLVSRGDGHVGEILPNAKFIMGLPKPLDRPVRMEVCIDKDVYITIPGINKNSRNVAAGILRRKEQSEDIRYLTYYAYNILGSDLSEENQLIALRQNGFKIVDYIKLDTEQKYKNYYNNLDNMASGCLAPTDGIVIKCNLPEDANKMGMTAHHPNNMVAYKFVSAYVETTIKNIEWSRGRHIYTPVAVFEPICLNGSIVKKASLHNLNIMKQLNIKTGSKVLVTLKNEIIPQIISCNDTENSVECAIPDVCPYCDNKLKINDSDQLICDNSSCGWLIVNDIERLASKQALDIVGISYETSLQLATYIYKNNLDAISFVNFTPEALQKALDTTYYMATKLYNSIHIALKEIEPSRFLYACNIPNIGINTAKDIMRFYNDDFYSFLAHFKDSGKQIDGIGDTAYNSVVDNISRINSYISIIKPNFKRSMIINNRNNCYNIAITGKLKHPRKYYSDMVTNAGHIFSSSINKKVNYLVNGNNNDTESTKIKKAISYGIKIISEEELINILKEGEK